MTANDVTEKKVSIDAEGEDKNGGQNKFTYWEHQTNEAIQETQKNIDWLSGDSQVSVHRSDLLGLDWRSVTATATSCPSR